MTCFLVAYLNQLLEEVGLVPQRVGREPVGERDQAVREIVLKKSQVTKREIFWRLF